MLDAESKQVNAAIMMLDSNGNWQPATDPLHFDKPKLVGVGPGLSFANAVLQKNPSIKIGLIPCAVGGSPIIAWQQGAEFLNGKHPYDDAIARAKIAMKTGVLKGIVWHQGESDNDSAHAAIYIEELTAVVSRFRAALQIADLPFVAGEIGYFNKANFINPLLNQLPALVAFTAFVSANGLVDGGDHLHFNTASARELGRRYASAMLQLQKSGD
jgi:hypothetical protein